jgi:hypothetical protein
MPSTTTATSAPHAVPPGNDPGRRRPWIVGTAIAAFVLLVAVIAVMAPRGDDGETATPGGSTTEFSTTTEAPTTTTEALAVTAAPAPTPAPAPSPGAAGGAALEDGRHAVRITNVDVSGRTVQFDVIRFLLGDEATAAYREDHPEDPNGFPENDYYIVNDNPRLRTLPVADAVTVTVLATGEPEPTANSPHPIAFAELPAYVAQFGAGPFWLTVNDGNLVAVEQQYVP